MRALDRLDDTGTAIATEQVHPMNDDAHDDIKIGAACMDCGLDYEKFPMDTLLPRWQWLLIHPAEGGLLCANCIVARAAKVPGAVGLHAVIGIAPPFEEPVSADAVDPHGDSSTGKPPTRGKGIS
jgi:hypothetical protein